MKWDTGQNQWGNQQRWENTVSKSNKTQGKDMLVPTLNTAVICGQPYIDFPH